MSSVLLILGAGPNIGKSVGATFSAQGWRIVAASRSRSDKLVDDSHLDLHVDLSKPDSLPGLFAKIRTHFGTAPSAVIYNGYHRDVVDAKDPLSALSIAQVEQALVINVTSTFAAAKEAVAGFKQLPAAQPKVFIFTGNLLNATPWPHVLSFGTGKSAAAKIIWDSSVAYKDAGFKFYYADERSPDGKAAGLEVGGESHAAEYLKLVQTPEQGPWLHTFVKGKGYTTF